MRRKCLFLKLDSVPESSSLTCCASCGKCSGGVSGFPEPTVDSSLQVLSCIAISTEQAKQGLKSQIVSKIYFDKNCFFHFGLEELSPFFFHRISSYLITGLQRKIRCFLSKVVGLAMFQTLRNGEPRFWEPQTASTISASF